MKLFDRITRAVSVCAVAATLLLAGCSTVEMQRASAEKGNAEAQYNLGVYYMNGDGVEQDYGQAMQWYLKAAEQGYALAQTNVGWLYQNGWGVAQDYGQATEWYRKAAEQGESQGQTNLGWLYEHK